MAEKSETAAAPVAAAKPTPIPGILKQDFEKDVVYLYQFPRANCSPSFSPFSLKLETWLRIADIKYENVVTGRNSSSKGQVPFVELNGKQYADSSFIIRELTELYHKQNLQAQTDEHKWQAVAFDRLLDGSLSWTVGYHRLNVMGFDKMFASMDPAMFTTTMKMLKPVLLYGMKRSYKSKLHEQGYGRHSLEEVQQIAKEDLNALNHFIGDKQFAFGDQARTLDASMFGHLAQCLFVPDEDMNAKKYIESDCKNLIGYMERIKAAYWPDWQKVTKEFSMESDWKK